MNKIVRLIIEMIVVGLSMVIASLVISILQGENILKIEHLYEMTKGVFMTGALVHFVFEVSGMNEIYSKNYSRLL